MGRGGGAVDPTDRNAPLKMTLTHTDLYYQTKNIGPEEDFKTGFMHSVDGISGYSFNYPSEVV
jgi:hypothetical protein